MVHQVARYRGTISMRALVGNGIWIKSEPMLAAALIVLLFEPHATSAGDKGGFQGAACEVKGCKCIEALKSRVNMIAHQLSVAQRISGELIVSKLAKLKRLYGGKFSMHERATSLLAWLDKKPTCIFVTEPFDGEPTAFPGDGVTIYGAVEIGAKVMVNSVEAPLDSRGRFAVIARLKRGDNFVTITVAKGDLKKQWKVNVPIKLDERLTLLDELCKRAEALGVKFEGARAILNEALGKALAGDYGRQDAKRLDEIIAHIRINLAQHRLSAVAEAASSCVQLKALWGIARAFIAAGNIDRAEQLLERIEACKGADPKDVPCKVEPVLRDGDWCYSISNGYVSLILSRCGGRIIDLRLFGIPMLGEGGIADDLGDETAGEKWVLIVEHASSELALLRAQTFIKDGIEFNRILSLVRGSPALALHYRIVNHDRSDAAIKWKLKVHPAIGYKNGGGNPMWDMLLTPFSERLSRIIISPGRTKGVTKRMPLKFTGGIIGAYDSAYKAGLGLIFDDEVFEAQALLDGSQYAFELSLKQSRTIPPKSNLDFALSLVAVLGHENHGSFWDALCAIAKDVRSQKVTPLIGRPK